MSADEFRTPLQRELQPPSVPSPVPAGEVEHAGCADVLKHMAAALPNSAAEIEVFDEDPGPRGGYWSESMRCPHGVRFWLRPSVRQISAWEGTS